MKLQLLPIELKIERLPDARTLDDPIELWLAASK